MESRLLYGENIRANGIRIHYLRFGGRGIPLIIIPGITSPAITWAFVAECLASWFDVYVLDVRGRGLSSTGPDLAYDADSYAKDISSFVQALKLEPCYILGHSMGARIAARLVAIGAAEISRLILADPPVTGPGRRPYSIPLEWFQNSIKMAQEGCGMEAFHQQTPSWAEEHIRLRAEWLHTCDMTAVTRSYEYMHSENLHEDLAVIKCPTLFLTAETGAINREELLEVLKIAPGFKSVRIEGVGHMMPFEDLDSFIEAVTDFLG